METLLASSVLSSAITHLLVAAQEGAITKALATNYCWFSNYLCLETGCSIGRDRESETPHRDAKLSKMANCTRLSIPQSLSPRLLFPCFVKTKLLSSTSQRSISCSPREGRAEQVTPARPPTSQSRHLALSAVRKLLHRTLRPLQGWSSPWEGMGQSKVG